MIHFETYNIHIYKQITSPWTDQQEDDSVELIQDDVLCGLLEAVTVLYLKQRGPLSRDLIVGAQLPHAPTRWDYERPFMTASLELGVLPLLRQMLDELPGETQPAGGKKPNTIGNDRQRPGDDDGRCTALTGPGRRCLRRGRWTLDDTTEIGYRRAEPGEKGRLCSQHSDIQSGWRVPQRRAVSERSANVIAFPGGAS